MTKGQESFILRKERVFLAVAFSWMVFRFERLNLTISFFQIIIVCPPNKPAVVYLSIYLVIYIYIYTHISI